MLSFVAVVLWAYIQQPVFDLGVQEQRGVCHQQEEQNGLQSLQVTEMSPRRHVKVGFPVRETIELVQDPLLTAGAATATYTAHADQ